MRAPNSARTRRVSLCAGVAAVARVRDTAPTSRVAINATVMTAADGHFAAPVASAVITPAVSANNATTAPVTEYPVRSCRSVTPACAPPSQVSRTVMGAHIL